MAMRRTTSLLLLVLLQASIGLVHSDEARESSIIRAAESSEQDKHNPMFKLNKLTSKDGQSPRTTKELESMLDTTLDGQIFHPLTNMQPSHPDVVTHAYADTKPDNIVRLPIGVPTSIFCLFQNQGPSPLTLTHVAGSLNAPATFRVHFQNFTVEPLLFVVPPGEEVTVQYDFTPKTFLRPGAFQVAHTIFYEGEGDDDMFSTTFFNQSILVVAPTDM